MCETLDFYVENTADFISRTSKLNLSALYAEFLPLIPPGGSILDAGCGSGRDSRYFINRGYTVPALDAASEMAEQASELIGEPVEVATFENFRSDSEYNGIWACASLLHVPQNASHLQPGGILYMSFKYGHGQPL